MKKSLLLICGIIGECINISPSYSLTVNGCVNYGRGGAPWYGASPTTLNCNDYDTATVNVGGSYQTVVSCVNCSNGYRLSNAKNGGVTACEAPDGGGNGGGHGTYTYYACEKYCDSTNCATSAWSAFGTGYEKRMVRSCSSTGANGTCNSTAEYRCEKGYYGTSTNGTSGCSPCPGAGLTGSGGATNITACFLYKWTVSDSDMRYYDQSGEFLVTETCYYSTTGTPKYQVLGMKMKSK